MHNITTDGTKYILAFPQKPIMQTCGQNESTIDNIYQQIIQTAQTCYNRRNTFVFHKEQVAIVKNIYCSKLSSMVKFLSDTKQNNIRCSK